MSPEPMSVLVVEHDEGNRNAIGRWLEAEGFDVLVCPGPTTPDYFCVGARLGSCGLAAIADVVVLDLRLASDDTMQGVPSWQLMPVYASYGSSIVAIADADDVARSDFHGDLTIVGRPPEQTELIDAVRNAAARRLVRRIG